MLTIITVVKNDCDGFVRTLESIRRVKDDRLAYFVFDGCSTDGTLKVAESTRHIDLFKSERDEGIYHAMNKAASHVTSQWFMFLNAGDTLIAENFFQILELLENDKGSSTALVGGYKKIVAGKSVEYLPAVTLKPDDFVLANPVCHQSTIYNASSLDISADIYDLQYKYIADQVLLFKLLMSTGSAVHSFQLAVCSYDTSGISSLNRFSVVRERIGLCERLIVEGRLKNVYGWRVRSALLFCRVGAYYFARWTGVLNLYRKFKVWPQ